MINVLSYREKKRHLFFFFPNNTSDFSKRSPFTSQFIDFIGFLSKDSEYVFYLALLKMHIELTAHS